MVEKKLMLSTAFSPFLNQYLSITYIHRKVRQNKLNMIKDENFDIDTHEELCDISLVSACITKGLKIEGLNRDPKYHPRVGFIFKRGRILEETIRQYLNGDLLVEPKEFFENLRQLKSRTKIPY